MALTAPLSSSASRDNFSVMGVYQGDHVPAPAAAA